MPSIDEVIVAITTRLEDDVLEHHVRSFGASVFRGEEDDVMGRVLNAAQNFMLDIICEVTGDCPIIDISLTEQAIKTYLINDASYVNNGRFSGLPDGMGCQIFSTDTLLMSASMTNDPKDREHVTQHIIRNPKLFPAIYLAVDNSNMWPGLGLTLDEQKDYDLLKIIIEHFGESNSLFSNSEVIQLLLGNPSLIQINQHVKRIGAA